ncbi:MAG: hypothetical protein KKD17_02125 [Nanoarchaeota archaeon]|nr:hypothetical protein [Nanoarchaeota archaeon]
MAVDDEFDDDRDDVKDYVCASSGITGREMDAFVQMSRRHHVDSYLEVLSKYGPSEDTVRRFMYSHLLMCEGCRREYWAMDYVSKVTEQVGEKIKGAVEGGASAAELRARFGLHPDVASLALELGRRRKN